MDENALLTWEVGGEWATGSRWKGKSNSNNHLLHPRNTEEHPSSENYHARISTAVVQLQEERAVGHRL